MTNPLTQLHQFIVRHYSLDELRTLCLDLGVNDDELGGEGLSARTRELLLRLGRRGGFAALLARLAQQRPKTFDLTFTPDALYAALPAWQESAGGPAPKYQVDAHGGPTGIVGDGAHVEGGIHFHTDPPPAGAPLQRPPRADHFTDRKRELAQLLEDLQPGRVVTLCGPGGIGKTALAAEALWTLAPGDAPPARFPDGILFHSFYARPDPALALQHIVTSFGAEPRPSLPSAALRVLAGKRALLVLDGTEDTDDLRAVLDVRGGCGVLVTSRARQDALAERRRGGAAAQMGRRAKRDPTGHRRGHLPVGRSPAPGSAPGRALPVPDRRDARRIPGLAARDATGRPGPG